VASGLRGIADSELWVTTVQIVGWIVGILMLNHLTACLWYWLGNTVDHGWVVKAKIIYRDEHDKDANNMYMYLTSLHWACTQFTPASMEVVPVSSAERIVAVIVIFSSLVLCSSFLTSITTTVSVFRRKKTDYVNAHANMIRFLQENQIPMEFACTILDMLADHKKQTDQVKRLHEADVTLIKALPESMQQTLKLYVYKPVWDKHIILSYWSRKMGNAVAVNICTETMSQVSINGGHDLFTYGAEAKAMYFVIEGEILYYHGLMGSLQATADFCTDAFFCEQVLWMKLEHQGRATAARICELMLTDAGALRTMAHQIPELGQICKRMKRKYDSMLHNGEACEEDISKSPEELKTLVGERVMEIDIDDRIGSHV